MVGLAALATLDVVVLVILEDAAFVVVDLVVAAFDVAVFVAAALVGGFAVALVVDLVVEALAFMVVTDALVVDFLPEAWVALAAGFFGGILGQETRRG